MTSEEQIRKLEDYLMKNFNEEYIKKPLKENSVDMVIRLLEDREMNKDLNARSVKLDNNSVYALKFPNDTPIQSVEGYQEIIDKRVKDMNIKFIMIIGDVELYELKTGR